MHNHECDVAVVGGGSAGAAAALAFSRQGCSVRLFGRRDLARGPSRGDILHEPTVQIARQLGILELLEARGTTRWRGSKIVDSGGSFSAAYQRAIEFYNKAASDPEWVRQYMAGFGGRVS